MSASIEFSLDDVLLAQSGNLDAFRRIVERTSNTVSSIALAIVKDLDSSEDIAQQVYINTWQHISELKNSHSFLPWLRQTTRYTAYNFLRNNKSGRRVGGTEADILLAQLTDPGLTPEQHLLDAEQSKILIQFVNEMPTESREILFLYYREGQSSKQVASLLGVSDAKVRQQLSRSRATIKTQLLEKYGSRLLSSAPTIGFTAAVVASLSASSPVAAAVVASSAASGKTGLVAKLLALIGGAFIGILSGALAIVWGEAAAQRFMLDQKAKQKLRTSRNLLLGWLLVSGVHLTASYELSAGGFWPILSYTVFVFGFVPLMWRMQRSLRSQWNEENAKYLNLGRALGAVGLYGGVLLGYLGLVVGLINNGRI